MASPPPNPDSRDLPYGWIQQYNWEYRQWFYVNTREQPPRSSWEHPLGPIPQGFGLPLGPPPHDRSYSRSPYGAPPPQGYGGYPSYQPSYGLPPHGHYNALPGGHIGGSHHGHHRRSHSPENRVHYSEERVVYVEEERRQQRKGPGLGTAVLAGGAGLVGGALLMDAIEDHNEYEREEGFEQGYQAGWDNNQFDGGW